jgi:alkylation response protein AidB-like acyl-CoA dehydrogenase
VNLELSEDQEFFRSTTRKFLDSEMPLSAVRALYDDRLGFDRDWWSRAAELGWTSMFVPESYGGGTVSGRPTADLAIVAEEMGRLLSPGPLVPVNVVAAAVARSGSDPLRSRLLPELVSGRSIVAWALCEPGQAWDAQKVTTTVEVAGGHAIVRGVKAYVEAAGAADHILVTGRTGDGLTQVIVPVGTEGLTVTPGRSLDMTRRFGRVHLDGVRVPDMFLVGAPGGAADDVERQKALALCLQCAEMSGIADWTLEMTIDYGRERFAFGRPIVSFQALKHRIADMTVRLEGSKAVTDALAEAIDDGSPEMPMLASVARAYVGEACLDVVDDCVQITGGIGVTWEHDIHMFNRRAAVDRAVLGTPEEHKQQILRHMLEGEAV